MLSRITRSTAGLRGVSLAQSSTWRVLTSSCNTSRVGPFPSFSTTSKPDASAVAATVGDDRPPEFPQAPVPDTTPTELKKSPMRTEDDYYDENGTSSIPFVVAQLSCTRSMSKPHTYLTHPLFSPSYSHTRLPSYRPSRRGYVRERADERKGYVNLVAWSRRHASEIEQGVRAYQAAPCARCDSESAKASNHRAR